jgi:hypothetical protein
MYLVFQYNVGLSTLLSLTAKKRLSGLDTGFVYFFEKIVVDKNFIVDVYSTIIKYY